MPLTEAFGLALGAVALVPPAYTAYKRCSEILGEMRSYSKAFQFCSGILIVQQEIFMTECALFLSAGVGNSIKIAREMIQDDGHPKWEDQDFMSWYAANMTKPMSVALTMSSQTLDKISKALQEAKGSKGDLGNGTAVTVGSPKHLQSFIDKKRRAAWSISGKQEVKDLLRTLRHLNQDFAVLRKKHSKLNQGARCFSTGNSSESPRPSQPDDNGKIDVFTTRKFAERLYEGLSSRVGCPCHTINIRLETPLHAANSPSAGRTNFQLVISPLSTLKAPIYADDGAPLECTCVQVESQSLQAEVLKPTEENTPIPQHAWKRRHSDSLPKPPRPSKTGGVQDIKFAFDVVISENPTTPLFAHITDNTVTADEITDLCSSLNSKAELQPNACMGFISQTSHRHIFYKKSISYSPSSQISLYTVLSKSEEGYVPLHAERLRIALIVSLSFLQYGTFQSSWFQDHWRSSDILFFRNQENGTTQNKKQFKELAPHISAHFDDPMSSSRRRKRQELTQNSQLFSLALVLTEIGFGQTLSEIRSPTGLVGFTEENSIQEFLKLQEIVKTQQLTHQVSRKYAAVVEKCFYCKIGPDDCDLKKRETQEVFYNEIVGRLRECVRAVEED